MSEPWTIFGWKSRAAQVGSWVVITIFLGALGSGLWNTVLQPGVFWVAQKFLTLLAHLFRGYADHLYVGVSRNPAMTMMHLPFLLVGSAGVVGPWLYLWFLERPTSPAARAEKDAGSVWERSSIRFYVAALIMASLSSLMYSELLFTTTHRARAALFVERSIEMLGPHIDDKTRLQLRAEFRGIESAADFYGCEDHLRAIAADAGVRLPCPSGKHA